LRHGFFTPDWRPERSRGAQAVTCADVLGTSGTSTGAGLTRMELACAGWLGAGSGLTRAGLCKAGAGSAGTGLFAMSPGSGSTRVSAAGV
jgi:hypothetical protein